MSCNKHSFLRKRDKMYQHTVLDSVVTPLKISWAVNKKWCFQQVSDSNNKVKAKSKRTGLH